MNELTSKKFIECELNLMNLNKDDDTKYGVEIKEIDMGESKCYWLKIDTNLKKIQRMSKIKEKDILKQNNKLKILKQIDDEIEKTTKIKKKIKFD